MLKRKPLVLNLFIWAGAIALCYQVFLTFSSQGKTPNIFDEKTVDRILLEPVKPIKIGEVGLEGSKLRQNVADILKTKPIDEDVFFLLAYASFLKTGDWDKIDLLHVGHKRNPRNKLILGALGDAHLEKGDVTSAISVLDLLLRLDPENRASYYPALSTLYKTTVGAKEIDSYLGNMPVWGHAFINREINTASLDNLEAVTFSLKEFSRNSSDIEKKSQIWGRLIKKYVKLGEVQAAYDIWLSRINDNFDLNDVKVREIKNEIGVYDANFKTPKALPPFNWALNKGQSYISERNGTGGLFVSYDDVKPRKIAWQIFPLGSNSSQVLSSQASWTYSRDHGYFEWRLMCSGSGRFIGRLVFDDKKESGSKIDELIDVSDADCSFVELQLWGLPGAYSKRISINIASVSMIGILSESEG